MFRFFLLGWLLTVKLYGFSMDSEMEEYLDRATATEDGLPSEWRGEGSLPFVGFLEENWSSILENHEQILSSRRKKIVILACSELLPSDVYLDIVNKFLDTSSTNEESRVVISDWVLSPGADKFGFLTYNYKHPKVRSICAKARELFPDDEKIRTIVQGILSGDAKKSARSSLSMNGRPEPEILVYSDRSEDDAREPKNSNPGHDKSRSVPANVEPESGNKQKSGGAPRFSTLIVAIILLGSLLVYWLLRRGS